MASGIDHLDTRRRARCIIDAGAVEPLLLAGFLRCTDGFERDRGELVHRVELRWWKYNSDKLRRFTLEYAVFVSGFAEHVDLAGAESRNLTAGVIDGRILRGRDARDEYERWWSVVPLAWWRPAKSRRSRVADDSAVLELRTATLQLAEFLDRFRTPADVEQFLERPSSTSFGRIGPSTEFRRHWSLGILAALRGDQNIAQQRFDRAAACAADHPASLEFLRGLRVRLAQ